jgi:outer membrane protein assembly factor BamB
MVMLHAAPLAAAVAAASPEPAAWDQFRGPGGSGVAPASSPPVRIEAACLAWKTPLPPGLSSPVLAKQRIFLTALDKDRLYMIRNGGLLTAVDATAGKVVYSERVGGSGQYSASPMLANEHLYLVSNRGEVSVVKAGDAFRVVHTYDLGEPAFVTPALDADTIYIRTDKHLCAFRARP